MVRGEKKQFFIAVCNKTGALSIYNEARNLFLSPFADGPIKFHMNPDGTQSIMNLSRFGRSFSILNVPYAFKLLIQELQVMNVQMRIITEDNIDQLLSMSYSDNINKLMKSDAKSSELIKEINLKIRRLSNEYVNKGLAIPENDELPEPAMINTPKEEEQQEEKIAISNSSSPKYMESEGNEQSPQNVVTPDMAPENNDMAFSPPYFITPNSNISSSPSNQSILEVEKPEEEKKEEEKKEEEKTEVVEGEKQEEKSNSEIKKITL